MRTLKYILPFLLELPLIKVQAKQVFHIWENTHICNKSVTLVSYLPSKNNYDGASIIVCPGGSYSWLDDEIEGKMVAEWLQKEGVSAFVLKYRVQGIFQYIFHTRALFGGHKHPDMILDLQRSIQVVRENADMYGINPHKLGVMGFSAGGHLALTAACHNSTDFLRSFNIHTKVSLRPDFVVAIYPVVTMCEPETHKRSRRALLGEWGKFKNKMRDSLSIEKHIPNNCPPIFIVNCADDPIVKCHNSEMLDSALTSKNIPHKYIQYKSGKHGFGATSEKETSECRKWKKEFMIWLSKIL